MLGNSDWVMKLFGKFAQILGKSVSQRPRNVGSSNSGSVSSHPSESGNIVGDWFKNLIASLTGNQLTDAQREANQFTHDERIDAQNWTAQREDTELQRRVADARAAGINPMMVAGNGGVSSPSSGGQSVNPSSPNFGIGDLMSIFMMPMQMRVMEAQANNLNASASEKSSKVHFWEVSADKALAQIGQINAQIKTEGSKSEFYDSRALLARVNASNIEYLQESIKNLYDAQTDLAKSQDTFYQAQAFANWIHASYEKGLIDSGYIDSLVKRVNAETADAYASASEHRAGVSLKNKQGNYVDAQASGQEIANSLANGTFTGEYMNDDNVTWFDKFVIQGSRLTGMFGNLLSGSVGLNITNK